MILPVDLYLLLSFSSTVLQFLGKICISLDLYVVI